MNPKVILIDGKTYHSVNEMPPEVRQQYEQAMRSLGDASKNRVPDAFESASSLLGDKDKDGVPDVFENMTTGRTVANTMKVVVDGKEYNSLDSLPPEARARYEEAMGKLDANRNGIPDFAEEMISAMNVNAMRSSSVAVGTPRRATSPSASPTITPDTSNGWMLMLAGLFIFFVCIAGAGTFWYFFLR